MKSINHIKHVWFIGIGGIGMSAIARYFKLKGLQVAGYDRTPSVVTDALVAEGIDLFFCDDPGEIAPVFRDPDATLVVFTPAVESSQRQLVWFQENGFSVMKRSKVLGIITRNSKAICVAGTHGKTTISTITAHLFRQSAVGGTAFLGGISKNYHTNFLWDEDSPYTILEADEFDRSFLQLTPSTALVSAIDADHLDIYGDRFHLQEAFIQFGKQIKEGGVLLTKDGLKVQWQVKDDVKVLTYSLYGESDFYAKKIILKDGYYQFTLVTPDGEIQDLKSGIPGLVNVENAIGSAALALINGVSAEEIKAALPHFTGIARRFDLIVESENLIYIDDYAHHPEEIKATLESIRAMFPGWAITGAFQPHLYTRTRDFARDFAKALSMLDELYLLDIYPAREKPIEGVNSLMIGQHIKSIPVHYCSRNNLVEILRIDLPRVIVTMGAGDIDREVVKIKDKIESFINEN